MLTWELGGEGRWHHQANPASSVSLEGATKVKHKLSKGEVLGSTPCTTGRKKAKPSTALLSLFL